MRVKEILPFLHFPISLSLPSSVENAPLIVSSRKEFPPHYLSYELTNIEVNEKNGFLLLRLKPYCPSLEELGFSFEYGI
jgi:hypothetical protein